MTDKEKHINYWALSAKDDLDVGLSYKKILLIK